MVSSTEIFSKRRKICAWMKETQSWHMQSQLQVDLSWRIKLVVVLAYCAPEKMLPDRESNPGLPRDRRGYSPLYYRGLHDFWSIILLIAYGISLREKKRNSFNFYVTSQYRHNDLYNETRESMMNMCISFVRNGLVEARPRKIVRYSSRWSPPRKSLVKGERFVREWRKPRAIGC